MNNKKNPVLVTGANGFVASWLVKKLLENGHIVHAAIRDLQNKNKMEFLKKISEEYPGSLKFFQTNLLTPGSYKDAMAGCEVVFHTASPFLWGNAGNPQEELVEPALKGTINVLEEANKNNHIQRIVLTSSSASIWGDNIEINNTKNHIFTEENWNTTSSLDHNPYYYSKAIAERTAWDIAKKQDQWKLVTINPSAVFGPGLNPNGTKSGSYFILRMMGSGQLKSGVPENYIPITDSRDVAEAHYKAAFTSSASGRYIINSEVLSMLDIAKILRKNFGDKYPFPKKEIPKWLIWLVGPLLDKNWTRKYITKNVGYKIKFDNSKSIRELGMKYRPASESIIALFKNMIDNHIL